jgi:hypothetical protein
MRAWAKLADWRLKFFLWVGLPVIANSGARAGVFATGGGSTDLLVTGFTVAAAVGWVIFLLRTFRRRNAKPETPLGALNVN